MLQCKRHERVEIKEDSLKKDVEDLENQFDFFIFEMYHKKRSLCVAIEAVRNSLGQDPLSLTPALQFVIDNLQECSANIEHVFATTFRAKFKLIVQKIEDGAFEFVPKLIYHLVLDLNKMEIDRAVGKYVDKIDKKYLKMKRKIMSDPTSLNFSFLLFHGVMGFKNLAEQGLEQLAKNCVSYTMCFEDSYLEWKGNK